MPLYPCYTNDCGVLPIIQDLALLESPPMSPLAVNKSDVFSWQKQNPHASAASVDKSNRNSFHTVGERSDITPYLSHISVSLQRMISLFQFICLAI